MRNNNRAIIRRLSGRSLKNNRMRNAFVILAIILTSMLFTAVFSLGSGMMQVAQEQTMREVGGKFHAGLKRATMEQYEKVSKDPMVKRSSYNVFLGFAENILKRQTEIRFVPDEGDLDDYFIQLEEGQLPKAEDEIIVDTLVMDELGVPYETGVKIPLTFEFCGERIEKEFTVSGWYQGDYVSHASECFVSENFWKELKGNRTDADFQEWYELHPEDSGAGLLAVNLFFNNSSNLEQKVRTVIENAGYTPDEEIDYGVNWAYMQNRLESVDPLNVFMLGGAILVILLTGYLIIYNIFQISVMTDIRFYGLLKTVGTTKKQLRHLISRQALILSVIGIPIGILLGYGIGKWLLPFAMSFMNYEAEIALAFHPLILAGGAGFSALTVFLSCRKPGKIAGSVSPVEAVRYTEGSKVSNKKKRKQRPFRIFSMAMANLGRNRKKTGVVVAAISLSVILLSVVMTGVGSFRIDSFLEARITGDFILASTNITGTLRTIDLDIDEAFLQLADAQEGILEKNEMWWYPSSQCVLDIDEAAIEKYRALDEAGKLDRGQYTTERVDMVLNGELPIAAQFYGYSTPLLENLTVLEGKLDAEEFQKGGYILVGAMRGNDHMTAGDGIYHPGDQVRIRRTTEKSQLHEVKNEAGETLEVWYDNMETVELEVMAVVDIPTSMSTRLYVANGMDMVLPLEELKEKDGQLFAVSYKVEPEKQAAFVSAVEEYTTQPRTTMGYLSKELLRDEFSGMIQVVGTIGIALAVVIALIGILNFVNAVITGIIARKREFAMLQSIGMTKHQLQLMLVYEGIGYVGIAGVISLFLGTFLGWRLLISLNEMVMFFEYRFQIAPFLIMLPVLLAVAVIGPLAAFSRLQKRSIVERLREAE